MKNYTDIKSGTLEEVVSVLKQICKFRNSEDVSNFNNLNKIFIRGRQTGRVPSASNDVITGDILGDYCPTATYLYILINNSGTPEWRRITAASW